MSVGLLRRWSFSGLPLQGHRLVRLIHLDEAGISGSHEGPYVVVAGTIIEPDAYYKEIENDLQKVIVRYVSPDKVEVFKGFHATSLFSGTGKVFKGWKLHETMPIIERIVRVIKRHNPAIIYGVCDRDRYGHHPRPARFKDDLEGAYTVAFILALLRANRWMRRNARPDEVAMVVVEDNNEMRQAAKWAQEWLRFPVDFPDEFRDQMPLERIIESVLFAKKEESYVLWLADMCAYLIKREIAGQKTYAFFDWIAPLIDRGTNVEGDPVARAIARIPRYGYRLGALSATFRSG